MTLFGCLCVSNKQMLHQLFFIMLGQYFPNLCNASQIKKVPLETVLICKFKDKSCPNVTPSFLTKKLETKEINELFKCAETLNNKH